jgi:hypothetical protein
MVSQKIGKADEVKQYRRLFAADADYRDTLPTDMHDTCLDYQGRPDNWLVGKGWYDKSVAMVEDLKVPMTGQSPLIYRSSAPMCQMNYAEAMEKDGTFGEVARNAWVAASADWHRYGNENIPSSFRREDSDEPIILRLNEEEAENKAAADALAQLEKLQPGLRKKMIEEKKKTLTAAQRQALDTPLEKRSGNDFKLAAEAEDAIRVTHDEVARKVTGPAEKKAAAKKLAHEARDHEQLALYINRYRSTVNFDYWRQHAKTEQEKDVLTARQHIYQADRAFAENDNVVAMESYRQGLKAWRKVLDAHPDYVTDQTTGEDLMDMIRRYRQVLRQNEKPFPKPFILQDVIDVQQKQYGAAPLQDEKEPTTKKSDEKKTNGQKAGEKKTDAKKKDENKPDGKKDAGKQGK